MARSSGFALRRSAGPFICERRDRHGQDGLGTGRVHEGAAGDSRYRCPNDELAKAKRYLQLGLPGNFETTGGIAASSCRSLPTASRSTSITTAVAAHWRGDAGRRAARRAAVLDPDRLTLVIVGDRKVIEPGLRALKPGEIDHPRVRDVLGAPPTP